MTEIFENQEEFDARENKEDNGVTQDCLDLLYNGSLEEYEASNTDNTGCFNVVDCTNCTDCIECTNSSELVKCEYATDCTNCEELVDCSNCEDSSLLENCDNMESCADCEDCNFCKDAEGLVEESFVIGEESEDEEKEAVAVGVSNGQGADQAIDVFGDLSQVG